MLGSLPADLPAAVVVVQHQSPHAPWSALTDLLAGRSRLRVEVAIEGVQLSPGLVLVTPPGRHVIIRRDETIALIEAGPVPPARPSADLLLSTLAVATGSRCIAVVLSGTGMDGATGATAVHHFGGTVIASDETSSAHFGMPSETINRDDAIDYVLPVEAIGDLLIKLSTATLLADPVTLDREAG